MKQQHFYEPPTVEITEVAMEQGFVASQLIEGHADDTYEEYEFGWRS